MADVKPYIGRFVLILGFLWGIIFLILCFTIEPDRSAIFRRVTLDTPERKSWILITWPCILNLAGVLIIGAGGLIHFMTSYYRKRLNCRIDRIGISMFLIGLSFTLIQALYNVFLRMDGTDVFDLGIRWGGLILPLLFTGLIIILRKEIPRIISALIIVAAMALFIRNIPLVLFIPHTTAMKSISLIAWFVCFMSFHIIFTIGILISIIGDRIRKRKEIGFY